MREPRGQISHLTTADGLPDNEIQALALGPSRRVWIGTRRGLAAVDVSTLLKKGSPGAVVSFAGLEGLRTPMCERCGSGIRCSGREQRPVSPWSSWYRLHDRDVVSLSRDVEYQLTSTTESIRLLAASGADLLAATERDVQIAGASQPIFAPTGPEKQNLHKTSVPGGDSNPGSYPVIQLAIRPQGVAVVEDTVLFGGVTAKPRVQPGSKISRDHAGLLDGAGRSSTR